MSTSPTNTETRYRTLLIIWASMLMSVVLYAAVGYITRGAGDADSAGGDNKTLLLVFAVLAFSTVAASSFVKHALLRKAAEARRVEMVNIAYIVAFALAEVAALFGLVALFVTSSPYSYLLFAVGAFGLALHVPRRAHLWEAAHTNRF